MTICSVKQATSYIQKGIDHAGVIGNSEFDFINTLFRTMKCQPTDDMKRYVREAVDELEARHKILVTRDAFGTIVSVCKPEAVAIQASPRIVVANKPKLTNAALLPILHDMLIGIASEGTIITGSSEAEFIEKLSHELSSRYDLEAGQIEAVFGVLSTLGLRGNARKLRRSGMEVSNDVSYRGNGADEYMNRITNLEDRVERLRHQRDQQMQIAITYQQAANRTKKELQRITNGM